jgi:hypothetical protein
MQSGEYLRRKLQALPKVIMSPTPVDSSTYIWGKTVQQTLLKGCCPTPVTFPIVTPCTALPVDVGTASPADSYLGIKPAAYYSNTCPANSGAPPQLAPKRCRCLSPGNHNTLWANNVPVILGPTEYAALKACTVCSGVVATGCDENGFGC